MASVAQSFEEMAECCENKTAFRVPEAKEHYYEQKSPTMSKRALLWAKEP